MGSQRSTVLFSSLNEVGMFRRKATAEAIKVTPMKTEDFTVDWVAPRLN